MRTFLLLFVVSITSLSAQSPAEDKVTFESAIDWLNSKLDYLYYDENNGNWWNNTFYMNDEKVVTIKQISSKTPQTANIKNKNYTVRRFGITDINPFTIQVKDVDESMGRFVKGQLLEIRTFSDQKKIHKTINNRKATSTSFLHLSFPKALTDTLLNYPQLVKEKLLEAVISATKVYYTNPETNRATIFQILEGNYKTETNSLWNAEKAFENVFSIGGNNAISYFGYDAAKDLFYLTTIDSEGVDVEYFSMKEGTQILLVSTRNESNTMLFDTLNSFRLGETWYYRQ